MKLHKISKTNAVTHAICWNLSIASSVRCSFGAKREAIAYQPRRFRSSFTEQLILPAGRTQIAHSIALRSEQWFCRDKFPRAFYLKEETPSMQGLAYKWLQNGGRELWSFQRKNSKLTAFDNIVLHHFRGSILFLLIRHVVNKLLKLRTKKKRNIKDENPNRRWSCAEVRKSELILAPNKILKWSNFPACDYQRPITTSMEQKMP